MIKFDRPQNLNGAELLNELTKANIDVIGLPVVDGNNNFWLDIAETDKAKANPIVAAHNGTMIPPEPTIEDKLASVGLSVSDLKAALGL
jgi:hypothetical protein